MWRCPKIDKYQVCGYGTSRQGVEKDNSGHYDDKTKALGSFYLRLIFKECVDSLDQARLEFLQKNGKGGKVERADTNCHSLELEGFS